VQLLPGRPHVRVRGGNCSVTVKVAWLSSKLIAVFLGDPLPAVPASPEERPDRR